MVTERFLQTVTLAGEQKKQAIRERKRVRQKRGIHTTGLAINYIY
jgi:hypothetical protein